MLALLLELEAGFLHVWGNRELTHVWGNRELTHVWGNRELIELETALSN